MSRRAEREVKQKKERKNSRDRVTELRQVAKAACRGKAAAATTRGLCRQTRGGPADLDLAKPASLTHRTMPAAPKLRPGGMTPQGEPRALVVGQAPGQSHSCTAAAPAARSCRLLPYPAAALPCCCLCGP